MQRTLSKWLALLCLSGVLGGTALACDLRLGARGHSTADYVETVRPCLRNLPSGYRFDPKMEAGFLDEINAERAARGIAPLAMRPELLAPARFQSLDMAANHFFDHNSPDGRSPADRLTALDRRALIQRSAENLAMMEIVRGRYNFSKSLPQLHQNLMDSPGHRANILNPDLTHVAVGVVVTSRGVWATQVFLKLSGTLSADVPLRMAPGQPLLVHPDLPDWTFRRFEAETGADEYEPFRQTARGSVVPDGLSGDVDLTAFSIQMGDRPDMIYSIRLVGPSLTID
ncbi:CAP domain-containing protein [Hyphomonas johnsonii]|uniref:SCP-like extracellular family protein n=1 Tax=Hyphomonas johnsonii MHS-2 TaxID=1280950 RepID=A0A059FLQ6_9PROT|nr:CAP domain-containing protein [Hyphomonas johnsonii]KCZ91564.1 SCP-like extracellular family protein [Hyphomonas johnsonii MHS-2]